MKKILQMVFGLVLLGAIGWAVFWFILQIWRQFKLLDIQVSVAILTAATTVIVATLTVVLGKYYERIKDIEAHYRQKKTEIYDEFLVEFFKTFHSENDKSVRSDVDMASFLREWQRKMILWGGQDVLSKYLAWMSNLKKGEPNAQSVFLMEEFFIEIRKELGHKNNKLKKGTFIQFILQNTELFLEMAEKNPNLTLAELGEAENAINAVRRNL